MLSGINSVRIKEVGHVKKFSLIKHNLAKNKTKVYDFSVSRKNRFQEYFADENTLHVLSKRVKDGQTSYYIDVIGFEDMKYKVENKRIIQYPDKPNHEVIFFEKHRGQTIIVFEYPKLINNEKKVEIFILNDSPKVIAYHTVNIPSDGQQLFALRCQSHQNFSSIIFKSNTYFKSDYIGGTDSYVVSFNSDTTTVSNWTSPNLHWTIESVMLDSTHMVSLNSTSRDAILDSIVFLRKTDTSYRFKLSPISTNFREALKSWERGLFNRGDGQYRFTQVSERTFLFETFKQSMNQKSGGMNNLFGPALLFKTDLDTVLWMYEIYGRHNIAEMELDNMPVFEIDGNIYMLYKNHKRRIQLTQINGESGEMQEMDLAGLEEKWIKSHIYNWHYNSEEKILFAYLMKLKTRPFILKM